LLKVDNPVIDKDKKLIKIDNYQEIRYEKCLLATAGNPRAFYVLGNSTKTGTSVNSLNAMNDFERLEGIIPELGKSADSDGTAGPELRRSEQKERCEANENEPVASSRRFGAYGTEPLVWRSERVLRPLFTCPNTRARARQAEALDRTPSA